MRPIGPRPALRAGWAHPRTVFLGHNRPAVPDAGVPRLQRLGLMAPEFIYFDLGNTLGLFRPLGCLPPDGRGGRLHRRRRLAYRFRHRSGAPLRSGQVDDRQFYEAFCRAIGKRARLRAIAGGRQRYFLAQPFAVAGRRADQQRRLSAGHPVEHVAGPLGLGDRPAGTPSSTRRSTCGAQLPVGGLQARARRFTPRAAALAGFGAQPRFCSSTTCPRTWPAPSRLASTRSPTPRRPRWSKSCTAAASNSTIEPMPGRRPIARS